MRRFGAGGVDSELAGVDSELAGVEDAKAGVGGGSGGRHRRPRRRPAAAEKLVYERERVERGGNEGGEV
jgi:hypothetical protein